MFAAEASWKGKLEPLGFEEDLVDLAPPARGRRRAGRRPVLDRLHPRDRARVPQADDRAARDVHPADVWASLIDGAKYCEPQLREIIDRAQPDVIVEDNVERFPALMTAGAPFVRIMSLQPARDEGPGAPADLLRLPDRRRRRVGRRSAPSTTARTATTWEALRRVGASTPARRRCPTSSSSTSPTRLNLYVYPEVADYPRARPLDATWHRLDSCVRETDERVRGAGVAPRPATDALVYLSLGSLGSADVELMRRLVDVLAETPHRYIVSKGPQRRRVRAARQHVGRGSLPQTSIIPLVDLVITHGGNNTTTEALPLRQADDRAAAVLGPVRQRAAGRRARLRRPARHLRVRGPTSCATRSTGCSPTRTCTAHGARRAEAIRAHDGNGRPPT